jgi:ketosteroid isomerase-like protein
MTSDEFDTGIEKEVVQARNEYFTAIKNRDAKKLGDILADDFVFRRNPFGGERSKEEFLAGNASSTTKILSDELDNAKVSVFGGIAVMTGILKLKIEAAKQEESHSVAITNIFVKRDEKWLLIFEHFVDLPPY